MDLVAHLTRQMVFSRATFGPGPRTEGVVDHIKKELAEVAADKGSPAEWADVVILALDGLTRSVWAEHRHSDAADVAAMAVGFITRKPPLKPPHGNRSSNGLGISKEDRKTDQLGAP